MTQYRFHILVEADDLLLGMETKQGVWQTFKKSLAEKGIDVLELIEGETIG